MYAQLHAHFLKLAYRPFQFRNVFIGALARTQNYILVILKSAAGCTRNKVDAKSGKYPRPFLCVCVCERVGLQEVHRASAFPRLLANQVIEECLRPIPLVRIRMST